MRIIGDNGAGWQQWTAEVMADCETGFSCGDLGHLNGKLLSLDAWQGSKRNKTQTRGSSPRGTCRDWCFWGKGERVGCSSLCDPQISTSNFCRAELEALASPALHPFESSLSLCSLTNSSPEPEPCRKKGGVKWKQLLGSENKRKLSG